jgi:hypothetical protein
MINTQYYTTSNGVMSGVGAFIALVTLLLILLTLYMAFRVYKQGKYRIPLKES